jgi:hypothetical protein
MRPMPRCAFRKVGTPSNACGPVGQSGEFAASTTGGGALSSFPRRVARCRPRQWLRSFCNPNAGPATCARCRSVLSPTGAATPRAGADELCSRSGAFRIFGGWRGRIRSVSASDRSSRRVDKSEVVLPRTRTSICGGCWRQQSEDCELFARAAARFLGRARPRDRCLPRAHPARRSRSRLPHVPRRRPPSLKLSRCSGSQ